MRSTGKYELIIVWTSGEKETHFYHDREFAELARDNMLMVFGNQIEWIGITKRDHIMLVIQ